VICADHAPFYHALKAGRAVACAFVFDTDILQSLPQRADRRADFIWQSVQELAAALRGAGGELLLLHGSARDEIPKLAATLGVQAVYVRRDRASLARHASARKAS
jgi:deoxyribodipyrimidine photo-lyase